MNSPETDSAFWLYPDWDGPLKEPFWMRPPKMPEPDPQPVEVRDGAPIPLIYGTVHTDGRIFMHPGDKFGNVRNFSAG
jgi:hypothetical protein